MKNNNTGNYILIIIGLILILIDAIDCQFYGNDLFPIWMIGLALFIVGMITMRNKE